MFLVQQIIILELLNDHVTLKLCYNRNKLNFYNRKVPFQQFSLLRFQLFVIYNIYFTILVSLLYF